jgi:hypothetical protein
VPAVAGLQPPGVVGAIEPALALPAIHLHLAHPQHHQIDDPVAVDVQRIGADGVGGFQTRAVFLQLQRLSALAAVAVELCLADAGGHIQVGQPVVVAVEGRHATTDDVLLFALETALQAGALGFLSKTGYLGRRPGGAGPQGKAQQHGEEKG